MNKYELIAQDIYNDIASGKYEPGSQLALEKEMCAQYGVSRITIKRAVDELVKKGLVIKRRGSGTFVKGVLEEDVEDVGMGGQFCGFTNSNKNHSIKSHIIQLQKDYKLNKIRCKMTI